MCPDPRTDFPLQLIIILHRGKLEPTLSQHSKTNSCSIFNFSKANYKGITFHLISSDIEFIWNFIKAAIIEAMEIHIPKLRLKILKTWTLDSGLDHGLDLRLNNGSIFGLEFQLPGTCLLISSKV